MIGKESVSANSPTVSSTALLSVDKTDHQRRRCLNKQRKNKNKTRNP